MAYVTTDLYVGAWLMAQSYDIRIVPFSSTKRAFHFPEEAEAEVSEYFRGGVIPARMYAACLRDLKSLLNRPVDGGAA